MEMWNYLKAFQGLCIFIRLIKVSFQFLSKLLEIILGISCSLSQKCWLSEILCYALGFKMVLHTSNVRRQGLEGKIIHSLQNHMDSEVRLHVRDFLCHRVLVQELVWHIALGQRG